MQFFEPGCFFKPFAAPRASKLPRARGCVSGLRRVPCLLTAVALLTGLPARGDGDAVSPDLKEAESLRAAGRLEEALDVLREASRQIKRSQGEEAVPLLAINDLAAEILVQQGSVETAESLLVKTIATRQKLVDAGKKEHATGLCRSLVQLSRMQAAAKRIPDAIATARRCFTVGDGSGIPRDDWLIEGRKAVLSALDVSASFLGPMDAVTVNAREAAADQFVALGMLDDAITQRRQITSDVRHPARDEDTTRLMHLCRLMMTAGRAEEAVAMLQDAVDGGDAEAISAPMKLGVLRLLGEAQLAAGNFSEADASFETAISSVQAADQRSTAIAFDAAPDRMFRLLVSVCRGHRDPLPGWFRATVKDVLAKPPSGAISRASEGLVVAGDVLRFGGHAADAVGPLEEALRLAKFAKPPEPDRLADVAGRLAAAHLAAGDSKRARAIADPALDAAARGLGSGHPSVCFLRVMLADALCREGERDRAAALAGASLEHGFPRPNDAWEEEVTAVFDRLTAATGQEEWVDRYIESRRRQFGQQHRHVGTAWCDFGVARLTRGDWSGAARCFDQAVAVQRASLGDDHPDVAASLTLLAHAERAGGDPVRAIAKAGESLALWERIAGANHPGAMAAVRVLISARLQAGQAEGVRELVAKVTSGGRPVGPVSHAEYLVGLAGLAAAGDPAEAERYLQGAMKLPCWGDGAGLSPAERTRLACAAARAASIWSAVGDGVRSDEAIRKARSLAFEDKRLLERVERLGGRRDGRSDPR